MSMPFDLIPQMCWELSGYFTIAAREIDGI